MSGSTGVVEGHYCSRYGGLPLADSDGFINICNSARVRSAISILLPEAVLHLAGQSSVALSFENPASTFAVNFSGDRILLERGANGRLATLAPMKSAAWARFSIRCFNWPAWMLTSKSFRGCSGRMSSVEWSEVPAGSST